MSDRPAIFITGFPGFLARWLLRKCLVTDDRTRLYVLVEASERAQAERTLARLAQTLAPDVLQDRVTLLEGDVTTMDLGLSGEEFRAVCDSARQIFHLAAAHTLSGDRRHLEAVNVEGTGNVLGLARSVRHLERFVHFSSAYVCGKREGVIMEDELEMSQTFRNTYEETKHRAEVLARRAADKVPVTIIRPGGVVGDSRTGEIDRFDSVYHIGMLLVGSPITLPIPQAREGSAPLNLVPVDYVIDAVHAIVSHPASAGKTYHVVDPNPLPARRVYEAIAAHAGKKPPRYSVPVNLTKALLRIPGLERFAAVSHEALDYLDNMAFYNSRNTVEALEGTGIRCPQFEDYVDALMQYVRDYFERAGRWREAGEPEVGDRF